MIEGRATGTCSLGPLIRADVAASDSLQGTGLIKWRGSCELLGVFSPQMGAAVTFSYTIQGKATQSIPKKFRVLSSFADPLANNGRGQTTVELGCLLTYMEDAAEPAELNTRDDDELGNDTQADEDFDAIGASISAKYIFKQCAAAIGVTYSFNDGPLASTFRLDTIDLEVGYVSVMSDLLVSESMVGELDGNEVLQIRALTEAVGEAGKLLNTTNVLSIAPLNAGELPGENVAVQYSSWRLKEPDPDDGFGDNRWELSVTTGPIVRYYVQSGDDVFRLEGRSTTATRTTYESAVVDGKTISRVKEVETVKNIPEVEVAGEYYTALLEVFGSVPVGGWGQGLDGLPQSPTDRSIEITTYEYRPDGKVSSVIRRKTETWLAIVGRMNITLAWPPTVLNPPDGFALSEISETRYLYADVSITTFGSGGAGSFNRPDRVRRIEQEDFVMYPFTQEGQQAAAAGNARSETKEHAISQIRGMIDTGLISRGVIVTNEYSSDDPDNVVPSEIERSNSIGGTDDPLERSTETVWVYGDQQSIRRRVFRMPFAPDDLVTGTSGNYSVTPSNAEDVARLFGRVQNKLLFGARYGVQLQLLPVQVPAMAFDALNVDLAGVMGQFRLNNLSYVIEPGEVVCGCNALYWGTIGSTPYSGTASGSWVPLPARSSGYTAPQDVNTVEAGTTFVISSVGTTSQEDWNTLAGTSGVTYSEGDTITTAVDGSTLDSSTGTVSTLQPAPTPTSDATLGDVVVTSPEDVQEPFSTTERYRLSATRGRFLLTGLEAEGRLGVRYQLESEDPLFFLVGRPVELRKSIRYELTADVAVFSIAAEDIELVAPDKITADAGSFIYTGISTQLEYLFDTLQIGDSFQGGFFAGYISHTADGNPTHALIVAPRATGATGTGYTLTTNLKWADQNVANPANATLIGANNEFDGKVNTDLMMSLIANGTYSAGAFPAAQFCADLAIGGFTDWYLPARWELDIAYENLKPTTEDNSIDSGINDYSVPKRTINRTTTSTQQTSVTAFQSTGAEPFVDNTHWSSEQGTFAGGARILFFGNGNQFTFGNTNTFRVRAFRKVPL
jgi:hypothetical protein